MTSKNKAFLRKCDIVSRMHKALATPHRDFLALMTLINWTGFDGLVPRALAPVLENVRAGEAASPQPSRSRIGTPTAQVEQTPKMVDQNYNMSDQVAAELAP